MSVRARIPLLVQRAAIATLTRALFSRRRGPFTKILVLRSSRFGDFINAIPALAALRARFPEARITAVIIPSTDAKSSSKTPDTSYTELLAPGIVDEFQVVRFRRGLDWQGISEMRNLVKRIEPDATVVLPFSGERIGSRLRKLLFLKLSGVRHNACGFMPHSPSLGVIRHLRDKRGTVEHQIFGPLRALKELGVDIDTDNIEFPIRREMGTTERIDTLWKRHALEGKRVIAVFPGGTFEHKRWPLDKFEEFARRQLDDRNTAIVLLGSALDASMTTELSRRLQPGAIDLSGTLNFIELAEVLRRCALFVGNDSGPAHLSAAVGCPTVAVFSGIEFPGLWEPWNSRLLAVRKSVPCEFCFSFHECPTGTSECVRSITTDDVLRSADMGLRDARTKTGGDEISALRSR